MLRHLLPVIALFASAASAADVYKWTDADGIVHYSDTEPAAALKAERVHVAGMGKPAAAATGEAGEGDTAPPAGPPGTVVDAAAVAQTRCDQAHRNLELLQGQAAVALDNARNGIAQPLDDAARQDQIARAQAAIATYCK